MTTPYPSKITYHQENDTITESVLNTPLSQLSQRTDHLKDVIDASHIGSSVKLFNATVEGENILPGTPVYLDANGVFKACKAGLSLASDGYTYKLSDSAYVYGVVESKNNARSAVVVIFGLLNISETEIKAVTESGTDEEGSIWVSSTEGKLSYANPPYGIGVGHVKDTGEENSDGDKIYSVFVNPAWNDPFEDHIHYHSSLAVTETATTWSDDSGDLASGPAGAVYRYMHEDDADLANLWPPIPLAAVHIDRDGIAADVIGETDIIVNANGIWWMDSSNDPSDYSRIDLYFTRMTFKTSTAVVTSITPKNGSVSIQNANGDDATTGDLTLGFTFSTSSGVSTAEGSAVKEHEGGELKYGNVVDSIDTDTPSAVTITGLDAGADGKHGKVVLSVTPDPIRDNVIEFTELNGVEIAKSNDIYYLMINENSDFIGRFRVPESAGSVDFNCYLNFMFWLKSAGTLPGNLPISYFKIDNPAAYLSTSTLNPSFSSISGGLVMPGGSLSLNDSFKAQIQLDDTVTGGDIVYFKLERGSDSFGTLGMVSQWWSLEVAP